VHCRFPFWHSRGRKWFDIQDLYQLDRKSSGVIILRLPVMNDRIEINPQICHGKPVIRGTRVLVSTILGALGAGDSTETVLEDYPNLKLEDIHAALVFAGELSRFEESSYEAAS
jgi:uncharacterized protein (DUF433 family)